MYFGKFIYKKSFLKNERQKKEKVSTCHWEMEIHLVINYGGPVTCVKDVQQGPLRYQDQHQWK